MCCYLCKHSYHSLRGKREGSNARRRRNSGSRSSLSGPTHREEQRHIVCKQTNQNQSKLEANEPQRETVDQNEMIIKVHVAENTEGLQVVYLRRVSYSQLLPVKKGGQAQKLPRMHVPPFLQQLRL